MGADRSAAALSRRPRLTPGELGIELTTLLAIAGVCIYTVVLQINLLQTDALLPGDKTALTIARDIEIGSADHGREGARVFGRPAFVVPSRRSRAHSCCTRRRAPEALALSAGLAISRSRPRSSRAPSTGRGRGDPLVDVGGFSYPSGHATLSVTYLALAVVLSRAAPAAWRVALVIAGTVLAVAIGLSRVYLRVHYLSDVVGGWAVGLAVFSLCGAVALIVDYLRNNWGGSQPAAAGPHRNGPPHSHIHHPRRGRPSRVSAASRC